MTAVIDVGGGLRGSYGSGVFDYCLDQGIGFDLCIGVSAGAGNIASFLSKQRGRSLRFYEDYAFRKQYMSFSNLVRTGSYLDVQYIYGTLTRQEGEDPLDYDTLCANPSRMIVVASDAQSGKPRYFTKDDMRRNDYAVLMASSCIPIACKPVSVSGRWYFDGALTDPIPLGAAQAAGCDRVVVILTRPKMMTITGKREKRMAPLIRHHFPRTAENLNLRGERYNHAVSLARDLEREGSVLIVAPDDIEGMKTLTRDRSQIHDLYLKGYQDARRIAPFLAF
jgi:predicted patatin/cPLA2 family phospholipase